MPSLSILSDVFGFYEPVKTSAVSEQT